MKPRPKPASSPGLANCGFHIASSVSGLTIAPFGPLPRANSTLRKRPRSLTVVYRQPAGAVPSSNVGAGNSRPW